MTSSLVENSCHCAEQILRTDEYLFRVLSRKYTLTIAVTITMALLSTNMLVWNCYSCGSLTSKSTSSLGIDFLDSTRSYTIRIATS